MELLGNEGHVFQWELFFDNQHLGLLWDEAVKEEFSNLSPFRLLSNFSFEGTRDVRVLDRAKALRVAIWLHRLDMAVRGDQVASETLDVSQHCLGCLLESFLVPTTHDLTFREVVSRCLYENQCDAQHRLNDLVRHRNHVREELNDLVEAHREASGSS